MLQIARGTCVGCSQGQLLSLCLPGDVKNYLVWESYFFEFGVCFKVSI